MSFIIFVQYLYLNTTNYTYQQQQQKVSFKSIQEVRLLKYSSFLWALLFACSLLSYFNYKINKILFTCFTFLEEVWSSEDSLSSRRSFRLGGIFLSSHYKVRIQLIKIKKLSKNNHYINAVSCVAKTNHACRPSSEILGKCVVNHMS